MPFEQADLIGSRRNGGGHDIADTVEAVITVDDGERTVEVPDDVVLALSKAKLRKAFDALSYTHRKEDVRAITEAKKLETRSKRIATMLEMLRSRDPAEGA